MSTPLTEYYSISSQGYKKHPNIEILGIDPHLSRGPQSVLSVERDFQRESVIKQQENQYQPLEPKYEKGKAASSLTARMMEQQEVASIHLTPKCNTQSLTSSCIGQVPHRGILKRSLMELQKKNIISQEDANSDKQLYIQLEKERRLRRELEKNYKQLLSEMHRKERTYSVDLGGREGEGDKERRRQFSKRTLNYEKSAQGLMSYEELETQKDHKSNESNVKTVKLNLPQAGKIDSQPQLPHNDEQQDQQESHSQGSLSSSRKHLLTQQSADQQSDYFREQKQFQDGVMAQLRDLTKRIQQIDHFLLEKEREQERERLERTIQEKEREIRRVEQENQRLRMQHSNRTGEEERVQLNIMKKVTPTSLYFFLILIMALVAMS